MEGADDSTTEGAAMLVDSKVLTLMLVGSKVPTLVIDSTTGDLSTMIEIEEEDMMIEIEEVATMI